MAFCSGSSHWAKKEKSMFKKPGKKDKKIPHLWDFEGRCEVCAKNLVLFMTPVDRFKVVHDVARCPEHPNDALILYPNREDIIRLQQ